MSNYHFITHWNVIATQKEVYDIISDTEKLTDWWPSVYLDLKILEKGDENGIGKWVEVFTKGWLPYTLRWKFQVLEINKYDHIKIQAVGDFEGYGIWTIRQNGPNCEIEYDWNIRATKPLIARLTRLLKPIFSANHHWAMRQGEKSIKLELLRRRGIAVGNPPAPSFPHNFLNNRIFNSSI